MQLHEKFGISIEDLCERTRAHELYFELGNIYRFLELPEKIIRIEQFNSSASRSYYANALERSVADLETLKHLLTKKQQAKGYNEKTLFVYREAEELLLKRSSEKLSLSLLKDLHQLVIGEVNKSTNDFDLFTIQYHKLPEALTPLMEAELNELFEFINHNTELDPLSLSWVLHFELLRIQPFNSDAPVLARLLHYFWLNKHDLTLDGMLTLEQEIYHHRHRYFELQQQPYDEQGMLLNEYIEFGHTLFIQNLERLKVMLRHYFRKQVEYDDATPRQRNMMNFVFERGYKLNLFHEGTLNKRQELIMYIIHHKGFCSTKELTEEFGCNRKTIQRDFTDLLNYNMVRTIGNGSSLRYAVSIKENYNQEMASFMPDFLRKANEHPSISTAVNENEYLTTDISNQNNNQPQSNNAA